MIKIAVMLSLVVAMPAAADIVTITKIEILPSSAGDLAQGTFLGGAVAPVGVVHLVGTSSSLSYTDFYGFAYGTSMPTITGVSLTSTFNFGYNISGLYLNAPNFLTRAFGVLGADSAKAGAVQCALSNCTAFSSINPTDISNDKMILFLYNKGGRPEEAPMPTLVSTDGSLTFIIGQFSVPEPSTWAMLMVGFGGVGAAMRRLQAKTGRRGVMVAT